MSKNLTSSLFYTSLQQKNLSDFFLKNFARQNNQSDVQSLVLAAWNVACSGHPRSFGLP